MPWLGKRFHLRLDDVCWWEAAAAAPPDVRRRIQRAVDLARHFHELGEQLINAAHAGALDAETCAWAQRRIDRAWAATYGVDPRRRVRLMTLEALARAAEYAAQGVAGVDPVDVVAGDLRAFLFIELDAAGRAAVATAVAHWPDGRGRGARKTAALRGLYAAVLGQPGVTDKAIEADLRRHHKWHPRPRARLPSRRAGNSREK